MVAWHEHGFEAVVRLVHQRAGLVFSLARRTSVEGAIHRAMTRAGIHSTTRFVELIRTEDAHLDMLIAELTVGETYFFREPAQFDFIRREVVPGLLRGRSADRMIRAWSAGCATGEEPYSLAILFAQLGLQGRTRILGTEISRPRLAAARRARYGRWSFRGTSAKAIAAYFERKNDHFELTPELRAAVEFRWHNLAEDIGPAGKSGIGGMDLILCRNVMIYFDKATVAAVAERLLASLSNDGWLFLGAADPPLAELVPCTTVLTGNGVAYRRAVRVKQWRMQYTTSSPTPYPVPASAPIPVPARMPRIVPQLTPRITPPAGMRAAGPLDRMADLVAAYRQSDYPRVAYLAARGIEHEAGKEEYWALWTRALANQGQLHEAGQVCAAGMDRHRLSGELAYLHSILLAQAGHYGEAVVAARRALYLDREHVMAHLAHAQALMRMGLREAARRSFENAIRLLTMLPADVVVPASDGQRADRLLDLTQAHLQLLGGAD